MSKFEFAIQQKRSYWEECIFEIEAETKEEAILEANKIFNGDSDYPGNEYWEHMDGTDEQMSISENGGHYTSELFLRESVVSGRRDIELSNNTTPINFEQLKLDADVAKAANNQPKETIDW